MIRARNDPEWKQLHDEFFQLFNKKNLKNSMIGIFWEIDFIGMISLSCILVPFMIAGNVKTQWQRAAIIISLVIGFILIPIAFIWVSKFAKAPLMPLQLIKDRGIWAATCIAMLVYWIRGMLGEALYTVLIVGLNQSTKAATRISRLFVFVRTSTGLIFGLIITRVRRVKPFIIFGSLTWFDAMCILLHYSGSLDGIEHKRAHRWYYWRSLSYGIGCWFN